MKVFISSVRRGLEEERDSLRGLISAIGHTPLAFEDFTTQPVPSRQACLDGVAAADAYLLLIGAHYGHRFEDTGQSPTHDEWVAAQTAGIPRMVFLKEGVDMEDDQKTFYRSVSNYTSGVFYNSFTSTADLQTKVVLAIRALESAPGSLTWSPLTEPVAPVWRRDFDPQAGSNYSSLRAQVEVHVLGWPAQPRSTRQMSELASELPARIRSAGIVDDSRPVNVDRSSDGSLMVAIAGAADTRGGGFERVHAASVTGLRIAPDGQASIWASLPADSMGAVVDAGDLTGQIGSLLRSIGALNVVTSEMLAVALGIDNIGMLSRGRVEDLPRSQASSLSMSNQPVHVPPDELVSFAAIGAGAGEAARPLAQALADAATRLGR